MEAKIPLGLYLHIPFCVRKCRYCDFLSGVATRQEMEDYVQALIMEIGAYKEQAADYEVKTVYFGGGTPSVLEAGQIGRLLSALHDCFAIMPDAEITIEVNPGTAGREKFERYREYGANRLSIGLQSAEEEELRLLGRIHTFGEFKECFAAARKAGFSNISVDLISGLPGQTKERLLRSLRAVGALSPEHVSVYSLMVEKGTPFYEEYGSGGEKENEMLSEEADRELYELTKEELKRFGYFRYEISNYAKPGFESRHNSAYWQGREYLGFGVGAASLFQGARFCNLSDRAEYVRKSANLSYLQKERKRLSQKDRMEEFMFLGLRLCEGVSKAEFLWRFEVPMERVYRDVLPRLIEQGLLVERGGNVALTDFGIDVSNAVLAEFLLE